MDIGAEGSHLFSLTPSMTSQLALSAVMIVVAVLIHGVGLFSLSNLLTREQDAEEREKEGSSERHYRFERYEPLSIRGGIVVVGIVLAIFGLHFAEIWAFAFLYSAIGAVPDLDTAIYFSSITYATLGFTDNYIDPSWRMIAASEGIIGVLMLGWSTAFFVRVLSKLESRR